MLTILNCSFVQAHPYFQGINWDELLALKIEPPFKPKPSIVSRVSGVWQQHHVIPCSHSQVTRTLVSWAAGLQN